MADEELSTPDPADEAAKAETIRITLPAKPETPTAKRETVRINLPGKNPIPGITPKKETTKIVSETAAPAAPSAPAIPASGVRPMVPPPKPPSGVGAPPPPAKPMSGTNPPPKPPMLGKPGLPMKPGAPPMAAKPGVPGMPAARPAGSPPASGTQPSPVTQRAAAPKKETARITLPPEGKAGGLPKATVKMQQTQPLVRQPSASTIQTAPLIQTAPASISAVSHAPASDGAMNVLAIMAFIVSIGAAVLAYLAFTTAQLPS